MKKSNSGILLLAVVSLLISLSTLAYCIINFSNLRQSTETETSDSVKEFPFRIVDAKIYWQSLRKWINFTFQADRVLTEEEIATFFKYIKVECNDFVISGDRKWYNYYPEESRMQVGVEIHHLKEFPKYFNTTTVTFKSGIGFQQTIEVEP